MYRRLFAFRPDTESMHYRLSLVLLGEGRAQEALSELAAEPSQWWQAIGHVMAYDALGRRAEADALLVQVEAGVMSWQYQIAQIYAHRHDRERALL